MTSLQSQVHSFLSMAIARLCILALLAGAWPGRGMQVVEPPPSAARLAVSESAVPFDSPDRTVYSWSVPRLQGDVERKRRRAGLGDYPECKQDRLTGNKGSPVRVVVSLATTGSTERLEYLKRTVDSLWNQTVKPDRIILTFPRELKRKGNKPVVIPQYVQAWKDSIPALTVQQMEDYGPTSKLLGALKVEKDPETIVIVGDDDVQYHPGVVEALVCTILRPPIKEEVAPVFGGELPCRLAGKSRWHVARNFFGYGRGVNGVAYRVRYFDDFVWKVMDPETPRGCFVNDDVWIGGSMKKASGVFPYLVDDTGFKSVMAHGSCEPGKEGCGFQSDSATIANKDHDAKKMECEEYFTNFCCPEMCTGGKMTRGKPPLDAKPDTPFGNATARTPEEEKKYREELKAKRKLEEEQEAKAAAELSAALEDAGVTLLADNATCKPLGRWVGRLPLKECAARCDSRMLHLTHGDQGCTCADANCTLNGDLKLGGYVYEKKN